MEDQLKQSINFQILQTQKAIDEKIDDALAPIDSRLKEQSEIAYTMQSNFMEGNRDQVQKADFSDLEGRVSDLSQKLTETLENLSETTNQLAMLREQQLNLEDQLY